MSIELSLLKQFCNDKDIESTHYGYISALDNIERELKLLFSLVHRYYDEFNKISISKDELLSYYDLKYPRAKDRELHLDLITELFDSNISSDLMKAHLDHLIEKHHATKVINKLLPVMEGDKYDILNTISVDIDKFVDVLHNPPDSFTVPLPCELSVEELVEQEIEDTGLKWHLEDLTDIIGGLRKQTLGLIYAFVDSGKTSFAMAACANFASQLKDTEDTICYCGNEESAQRLRLRLVQAFTNWTRSQIKQNGSGAEEIAIEKGIDRVKVFDSITTDTQLEYVIKEYKPHVLFIDQAPAVEIKTKRQQEGVAYLETLFKWYRKLATIHKVGIIGIAQAVGDAEDSKYLKLSDIYGARVAIQGALDWACGIGRLVNNPIDDDLRYLNIPKNKLYEGNNGKITCHFNHYNCEWEVN